METKKRKFNGYIRNLRQGYDFYGLDKQQVKKLQNQCKAGVYPSETLQKACEGFEWLAPWILLSVQQGLSYDFLEYNVRLGRIPAGKSNFYGYRRMFFYNLNRLEAIQWQKENVKPKL